MREFASQVAPVVRQYFTPQARLSAAMARRKRAALKAENKGKLEVFAIISPNQPGRFLWQIRQYGAIVVETSVTSFGSQVDARAAGKDVLASGR